MPKKNKSTEMPKQEIDEVVEQTETVKIAQPDLINGEDVIGVYQVEYIEKKVYQFKASTRKEALKIVKDMTFVDDGELMDFKHNVKSNSLTLIGYKVKQ